MKPVKQPLWRQLYDDVYEDAEFFPAAPRDERRHLVVLTSKELEELSFRRRMNLLRDTFGECPRCHQPIIPEELCECWN